MNTTFRKKTPILVGAIAFALAACNPPTTTSTTGQGTGIASISGTVSKGTGPANNATIVLIKRTSGVDSDQDIVSTDSSGLYKFNSVPAGNYRVAFVIQSVTDRKNKTPQGFDPGFKTSEYFGALTTTNFDYDGNSSQTYQVPAFNVEWKSNLNASYGSDGSLNFTWSTVSNATGYNVLVKDINDNPFFKTSTLTSNSFSWSDFRGTEGNNNGQSIESGKTYYYIVNAIFDSSGAGPRVAAGNTTNGSFVAK